MVPVLLTDAHNAVTRLAQDAKSYDRAIELERLGGQMLDLSAASFFRN